MTQDNDLLRLSPTNPLLVSAGTASLMLAAYAARRRWGRIASADYITPPMIKRNRRIIGRCLKVTDADGIRVQHLPGLRRIWPGPVPKRSEWSKETISVRLAGVDAPEMAHFGNEAQPFSQEAFELLQNTTLNEKVALRLLHKDQYGRAVCSVYARGWTPFYTQSLSLLLAKAGLASLYTSAGAVYGSARHKKQLTGAIEKAQAQRVGIWGLSKEAYESPGDYKLRVKS